MSNLVTHAAFGGEETIARLRAAGVEIEQTLTDEQIAEMGLKEPQYGELIVGECVPEEAVMFHALWTQQQALDDATRTTMGNALKKMGSSISESDRKRPLDELLKSGEVRPEFDTDEEAERYFQIQQRAAHLHASFYWMIGERLGQHRNRLGVRSKFRIVTVESRY